MSFDLKIKNGDLVLNSSGLLTSVIGNDKIRQDVVKIMLTNLESNRFHPRYGSALGSLQIGDVADQKIVEMNLRNSAEESIRYLMSLQKAQAQTQVLSLSEVIIDITNISVGRDTSDPRLYTISVSLLTQKLDVINEAVTIRII